MLSNEHPVNSATPEFSTFATLLQTEMAEPRIEISGEDNEVEMTIPVNAATAPDGEPAADAGNGEHEAPAAESRQGTFIE